MKIIFDQSPNYYPGRLGIKPSHVIVHSMAGSFGGSIATFHNTTPGKRTSAHYLISKHGEVHQMVKDEDRAWHVGNANGFTIGIEHEDGLYINGKFSGTCENDPHWVTDIMLDTSAQLVAQLMKKWGIPEAKLETNVIGHNNPLMRKYKNDHVDPGPYFPWQKYYSLIRGYLHAAEGTKTDHPGV